MQDAFQTLKLLKENRYYYSLPAFAKQHLPSVTRLPISIRIILESLLRNCDGSRVKKEDVLRLAAWGAKETSDPQDIPFIVGRVLLQDFTGVPLLVDLAAMRDAVATHGYDPKKIEPQVPVDLIIDHSVQVDKFGDSSAFMFNLKLEFERNRERYEFLKWGQKAFSTFKVIPPGVGICHQINLEYLSSVVREHSQDQKTILFFDTLVGTDSHTTMINGLGVVGWGVGGIEAEAAMLGLPVALQTPEVIGMELKGSLPKNVTATDLALRITEILRQEKVVGKFVEFFGEGAASLSVADRATIANMAPEYGATMGFFPLDENSLAYLKLTGRTQDHLEEVKAYLIAQELFGMPRLGDIDYSKTVSLDLQTVFPCISGPKKPQDRTVLSEVNSRFKEVLKTPILEGGYGHSNAESLPRVFLDVDKTFTSKSPILSGGTHRVGDSDQPPQRNEEEMVSNRPFTDPVSDSEYITKKQKEMFLTHGSIVIASITSCTNTSNPSVMIGAGLLAKKAVEKGLKINPLIKTSLAPGSRVVTDYLQLSGLQPYLDELGFHLVGYGCTVCIGNSGPLEKHIEEAIRTYDLVVCSVLSGNRNFEARIHEAVKANFLMSPPLVIAFALAGRIDLDLTKEPLGFDKDQHPVFLKDIWPSQQEIEAIIYQYLKPELFQKRYAHLMEENPVWEKILIKDSSQFCWQPTSTYIQRPPFFENFSLEKASTPTLENLRPLAFFGDSVTTDHISPAGAFSETTPAGQYLKAMGVSSHNFNSYGSRRGNHQIMMRGTFANVRLKNRLAEGKEGGYTKLMPENRMVTIFEASQIYFERNVALIIFAGKDYGMGSSRDWAAKGPALLGVKVVVAQSFERIHRTNLIGMGILPLEFIPPNTLDSMNLSGEELFTVIDLFPLKPRKKVKLNIEKNHHKFTLEVLCRLDTQIEIEYYQQGGILPFVLRRLLMHSM